MTDMVVEPENSILKVTTFTDPDRRFILIYRFVAVTAFVLGIIGFATLTAA